MRHYAYIREIAARRGSPVMQARLVQPWAQEGTQAPLYNLLGAPLIAWFNPGKLEVLPARVKTDPWQFDFAGRATLLCSEIATHSAGRGDPPRVVLRWRAPLQNYRVFLHALGDADCIWAAADAAFAREMELTLRFVGQAARHLPAQTGRVSNRRGFRAGL